MKGDPHWSPLSHATFMARFNRQFFRTYVLLAWAGGAYWCLLALLGLLGRGPADLVVPRLLGVSLMWGFALASRLEPDPASDRVEVWGLALAGVFVVDCALITAIHPDPYLMVNFLMLALVFGVSFRRTSLCLIALGLDALAAASLLPLMPVDRRGPLLLSTGFSILVALLLHRLFASLFQRLAAMDDRRRVLASQRARLVRDLRRALAEVKTLGGLIPMCAGCKSVRNDHGFWEGVETYLERNADVGVTHGYCPDCEARLRAEFESLEAETLSPRSPEA